MVNKTMLQCLVEADNMKLSKDADDLIEAINSNGGYCIKVKHGKECVKKHLNEELVCPCYKYRKTKECIVGLIIERRK